MSNLLKSKFLLGALVVTAFLGVAVFSNPSSAAADCTITSTLRVGSVGVEVQCMQSIVGATADGKFGPMTLAAVKAWQAGHGLVADGVVGPMTRAAMMGAPTGNFPAGCTSASGFSSTTGQPCNTGPSAGLPAGCSSTAGYSPLTGTKCDSTTPAPSTGGLQGGAGDITLDDLSTYSGENVGEGASNVKVMGFSVEADDNSDVAVNSVKVEFFQASTADSRKLSDYADKVTVWMGSTKVGEADPSDFSESSKYYSKSISLSNAVVKAGDTEKFYVAVSALDNLDSGDIDSDDWSVDLLSVRFEDGDGVVTTETADASGTDGSGTYEKSFDFDSFASANAVSLKVALDTSSSGDAINKAHVVDVESGTTDTDGVQVLRFTIKAEGSDLNITEIPIVLTTTGETDESVIIKSTQLLQGSDQIGSESVTAGGAVTFDNLDINIDDGDTETFTVTVDLQDLTGALDEGDTVQASVTSTNADAIVAEDSSGEELADSDTSGSAVGEASAVYDVGFTLSLVSTSELKTVTADPGTAGSADQGQFVIKYKVTAFDGDIYIDNTCVEDNDGSEVSTATSYLVTNDGSNTTGCVVTSTADLNGAGNSFKVGEGTSETFTLTTTVTATADAYAQVKLEAIGWDAVQDGTGGGDANVFDFNLPGDFETDPLYLNII